MDSFDSKHPVKWGLSGLFGRLGEEWEEVDVNKDGVVSEEEFGIGLKERCA